MIVVVYGLRNNCVLKFLDLLWNGFVDDGVKVIGEVLSENNILIEFDIFSNWIFVVGVKSLVNGLVKNLIL